MPSSVCVRLVFSGTAIHSFILHFAQNPVAWLHHLSLNLQVVVLLTPLCDQVSLPGHAENVSVSAARQAAGFGSHMAGFHRIV